MEVRPFKPEDFLALAVQPAQAADMPADRLAHGETLAALGSSWTALNDGQILIATGLADVGGGRALAWSFLSPLAGRHLLAITRGLRGGLSGAPFRRVEMTARVAFPAACRWAVMLGFAYEGRLRAFFDDGGDAALFARVRP